MHSKLGVEHHEPTSPSPLSTSNSNNPLPKTDSPQLFGPRPGRMSRSSSLSSSNFLHAHSAVTKTRSDPPTSRQQAPASLPDVVVTVENGNGTQTVTVPANVAGMDTASRNKLIKTLEGKTTAWDALIHGSFS
ncbi:hypothetical protein PQX77_002360 [Marasmius sp. AFHP31]|nr:hypothetical protein PQX77_016633 [Marasmius sp. AFHP31]KAK1234439.1 hypothetical protein PQX77_002360 [Marasmius sp. AFHP31]